MTMPLDSGVSNSGFMIFMIPQRKNRRRNRGPMSMMKSCHLESHQLQLLQCLCLARDRCGQGKLLRLIVGRGLPLDMTPGPSLKTMVVLALEIVPPHRGTYQLQLGRGLPLGQTLSVEDTEFASSPPSSNPQGRFSLPPGIPPGVPCCLWNRCENGSAKELT